MQRALLPLLVVSAQAAFRAISHTDVRPEVEGSDKNFMKKDYPWDKRPVADKYYVFDHPYPAVQDSNDFDKDFVNDENNDGGRWKAQMEYDTLRTKIRAAKDKLKDLKEKMESEYEGWMKSKDLAASGADEVAKATGSVSKHKAEADAAAKKVNDLEGGSSKDGTKVGGSIGDAVKKVQDEMSDLEKCKKALADAKKRLKQLLKDKEDFEKKKAAAKEAEEKAAKEEAEQAKKDAAKAKEEAAADKKKKAVHDEKKKAEDKKANKKQKEEEDEDKMDEAAWQKKLDREKKDHSEALKNYEKELMDVKQTEDQLARAADNLRKFRRPPYVDDNGGVYNKDGKSSALSASAPVAMLLAVLAACFA